MSFSNLYWINALTPLHVGSGRGVGFIDLPVMREKATNYPIIPGSSVKGVLRDYFTRLNKGGDKIDVVFGTCSEDASNSGSLMFSDARCILLPIRSFKGTFAYVTSPLLLQFLKKLMKTHNGKNIPPIPELNEHSKVLLHEKSYYH